VSRLWSWVGPATRGPGTAAGPTLPTVLHDSFGQQLAAMLELLRSGEAFSDPITAERLFMCLVAVLTRLHEEHQVDNHGRCSPCRPRPRRWWPWPRRTVCTVHAAFASHMPHVATSALRGMP
jgi:hypothetical protein